MSLPWKRLQPAGVLEGFGHFQLCEQSSSPSLILLLTKQTLTQTEDQRATKHFLFSLLHSN